MPQALLGDGARSTLSSFICQDEKNQLNSQHLVKLPRSGKPRYMLLLVTVAYIKDVCYGNTCFSFSVHWEQVVDINRK